MVEKTLQEIAKLVDGSVLGQADVIITGVTNIDNATHKDITFAVEPHLAEAATSQAGAVIIPDTMTEFDKPAVLVANPRAAFKKLLELFAPKLEIQPGIHSTAIIGDNVKIGENVTLMPYAVIADDVTIGDGVIVYPHCYIGAGVVIGEQSIIYPSVTIREFCRLGSRVIVHSNTVIGGDGFGFLTEHGKHSKVPQVGTVIIEDDVEIGSHVGIDRATTDATIVKRGTKIDNLVHLGHNVVLGEDCLVVAQTGIAGSTIVGDRVTFAGQVGSTGHIKVGNDCIFAARSGLIGDVPDGSFYGGFPARPHKEWLRQEAYNRKIPDLIKQLRVLEKRLAKLED